MQVACLSAGSLAVGRVSVLDPKFPSLICPLPNLSRPRITHGPHIPKHAKALVCRGFLWWMDHKQGSRTLQGRARHHVVVTYALVAHPRSRTFVCCKAGAGGMQILLVQGHCSCTQRHADWQGCHSVELEALACKWLQDCSAEVVQWEAP